MLHRGVWRRRGLKSAGVLVALLTVPFANGAAASAWNQPKGHGQLIVKYEPVWQIHGFDQDGDRFMLPYERVDHVVSVWGEYGLTDRITLVAKTDWQDIDAGSKSYQGMGPVEIGAKVALWSHDGLVVSAQAAFASDSQGRNAVWGSPGEGEKETEARLLVGRSFGGRYPAFADLQLAHRWRDRLPDEQRLEGAVGVHLNPRYTVMGQVYAGKTLPVEAEHQSRWNTYEIGVVRHWNDWSAQAGWRAVVSGRNVNAGDGPIFAVWRRF